jgi:hypothetical protein
MDAASVVMVVIRHQSQDRRLPAPPDVQTTSFDAPFSMQLSHCTIFLSGELAFTRPPGMCDTRVYMLCRLLSIFKRQPVRTLGRHNL